jgi:D-3-phosphoglycerate dehydrogenase
MTQLEIAKPGSDAQLRCAILNDYHGAALRLADWQSLGDRISITPFRHAFADDAETIEQLKAFDVVCAMRERTRFPRGVLEQLPNLKMIATAGFRNAGIDIAAAHERGILVCGTRPPNPASYGFSTATLALALMLELARNVGAHNLRLKQGGHWQTSIGIDLYDATLGILGLGRLGRRVATMAKPLGMHVIAWSENLTSEACREVGVEHVSKAELFARSDFLTIHQVLTDRTLDLVGAPELALMKPTSFLINTSRGPIVNEAALIDALQRKAIRGAGLDVFAVEPLPADHIFRRLENVVITPHIGHATEQAYRNIYADMIENIANWINGRPVRGLDVHPSQAK